MKITTGFIFVIIAGCLSLHAADPTATSYTSRQCEGSLTPYPAEVQRASTPDSLEAVMINHVGRHGSRYPASSANCMKLRDALLKADSLGTLTETGRGLMALNNLVIAQSSGRWGALDSLGMAEQRAIASRMYKAFPDLFNGGTVSAISSYSPRVMMSMMSFVHQLDRLNNKPDFLTSTGRINSPLMRPFDTDADYIEFRKSEAVTEAYENFLAATCPTAPVARALGREYPFADAGEWRDLAMCEYYLLAGLQAMGMQPEMEKYLTKEEYNALWSCFNMRQYLQRTATTISTLPADIASALAMNIIETTDSFIAGENTPAVNLRFGHAETIMPLASLLRIPGCYYMTNYFDTVALHWRDFYVVPMASNIQFILFRHRKSGRYYLRTDLNETPVSLIPNDSRVYIPWEEAREFMLRCVPFYAQ